MQLLGATGGGGVTGSVYTVNRLQTILSNIEGGFIRVLNNN